MDYVLGIDSGGTNYRVEAQDTDGHQLGYYVGQPVNHYNFAKEEWQNRINENIDACLAQFGGQRSKVKALVCGTTGIDSDADEVMLNAFYRSLPGFACPMQVVNDAELAHYTVTGGTGVLVISGTGSIAMVVAGMVAPAAPAAGCLPLKGTRAPVPGSAVWRCVRWGATWRALPPKAR